MVVVTLTSCPPRLRGDITKWLMEIHTGVYVGKISARVRDELWERICGNIQNGTATMTYSAQNEQRLAFRIHNTTREIHDLEGIHLVFRPDEKEFAILGSDNSKKRNRIGESPMESVSSNLLPESYVVIDLETSGLDAKKDRIIEIGALKVKRKKIVEEFCCLINIERSLPKIVVDITGITDALLEEEGIGIYDGLKNLNIFVEKYPLIGHNITFDLEFLQQAFNRTQISWTGGAQYYDLLQISREKFKGLGSYRLKDLKRMFSINSEPDHRGLADCYAIFGLLEMFRVMK